MLFFVSDKAKLCTINFSKNSNLEDSGICFLFFLSRTSLKLYISVTPKLVKNVITNVDFSKGLGPDYIPVVVYIWETSKQQSIYGSTNLGEPFFKVKE